ncbi:MAG TPA: restriction endonuclease subunit S, partial [Phycisphaerales bacterium]
MPKTATAVRTYRFDQMATLINDRVDDPAESGVERYVGLEHLDANSLKLRRWGDITDVESTKLRFMSGDIIFGKRRVYQRKLAVADFEGICSAHAMVLRARAEVVLPDFLPFFMQSDLFMERALAISVGSLSPTINWTDLAQQEFALPPIEEQRRIAVALSASCTLRDRLTEAAVSARET